jgi:hypothetical protein
MFSAENFMYDFSANGQAGTYWYHSHQGKTSTFRFFCIELKDLQLLSIAMGSGDRWWSMIPTTLTKLRTTLTMVVTLALIIVTLLYWLVSSATTIITLADWYHTVSPQQSQPA